tara:strand:- start:2082 stop:2405 length:324 start_codon:yes stop_codon:yes gene_type:complete
MLDIDSIRNSLTTNLNEDKSKDVDVDINVNVLGVSNGKFNVQVHNSTVALEEGYLDTADITVGFANKDVMIDMFINGANPMGLVMGGQMTFNGDMAKGKSLKGLFVK